LIQALQTQAETWRQGEIIRARKMLAKGGSIDDALEALARGLTQKMMHGALAELHNADMTQRAQMSDAVARLFLRGDMRAERGAQARAGAATEPPAEAPAGDLDTGVERKRA
jgi:glutamyl-tRNA reductase